MGGLLEVWGAVFPNVPPDNFCCWGPPVARDDVAEKLNVGTAEVVVAGVPKIPPRLNPPGFWVD